MYRRLKFAAFAAILFLAACKKDIENGSSSPNFDSSPTGETSATTLRTTREDFNQTDSRHSGNQSETDNLFPQDNLTFSPTETEKTSTEQDNKNGKTSTYTGNGLLSQNKVVSKSKVANIENAENLQAEITPTQEIAKTTEAQDFQAVLSEIFGEELELDAFSDGEILEINDSTSRFFLFPKYIKKPQIFKFDGKADASFKSHSGTVFAFSGSSFALKGNRYEGEVTIKLREYYKPEEMILQGLNTEAGEKILESGGMFHIAAEDTAGNPLRFVRDNYGVFLPKTNTQTSSDNNMQTFYSSPASQKIQAANNWSLRTNRWSLHKAEMFFVKKTSMEFPKFAKTELTDKSYKFPRFFDKYFSETDAYSVKESGKYMLKIATDPKGKIRKIALWGTSINRLKGVVEKKRRYPSYSNFYSFSSVNAFRKWLRNLESVDRLVLSEKEIETFKGLHEPIEAVREFAEKNFDEILSNQRKSSRYYPKDYAVGHLNFTYEKYEKSYTMTYAFIVGMAKSFGEVSYYSIFPSDMGWINCDRFLDLPLEPIILESDENENMMVFVVAEKYNSFLSLSKCKGTYQTKFPKGETATLVVLKKGNENNYQIAKRNLKSGDKISKEQLIFEPMTADAIRNIRGENKAVKGEADKKSGLIQP